MEQELPGQGAEIHDDDCVHGERDHLRRCDDLGYFPNQPRPRSKHSAQHPSDKSDAGSVDLNLAFHSTDLVQHDCALYQRTQ